MSVEGGADVAEHALTRTDAPIRKAMDLPRCMSEEYEAVTLLPAGGLSVNGHPDAIGLAEITAMPRGADLPRVGEQVSGEVIWHAFTTTR